MTVTNRLLEGVLTDAIATGKTLDPAGIYVGLFITGPTVTPPATAADFSLPNATDMPAQAVGTWGSQHELNNGVICVDSPALVFQLPTSTHAFSAGGYYVADALTAGNILEWIEFGTPIPMPDALHSITIVLRLGTDPAAQWDSSVVIDG